MRGRKEGRWIDMSEDRMIGKIEAIAIHVTM